jgi:hypothetical protein
MDIAEQDIGGARVRRRFSRGTEALLAGHMLTGEEVRGIPVANRRALIDAGFIEVFPHGFGEDAGEKHIVHLGRGQYDVIQGHKLNDAPLTKDEAQQLAAV